MSSYPPKYTFLSQPPPPQKKRPSHPPPPIPTSTRKRSSTFSAIVSWADRVQPGSPGSPSIRRRTSLSRGLSVSSRCAPSPRPGSFLVIETPSPTNKDFAVHLTDLGYTSVFVNLPKSPDTPAQSIMKPFLPGERDSFSIQPTASIKRLRSLSILRSRSRSAANLPASPDKPHSPVKPHHNAASIAMRKKAAYPNTKSSKPKPPKVKVDLPPSLAAELALMQFADGGSTEDNIKRLMEAQARAAAPAGTKPSANTAVGDVYRDDKGGIWWDREEEIEYVHLLGGHDASRVAGPEKWVAFGGDVKEARDVDMGPELALSSLADGSYGRRDSSNSIASASSSLDPCNIVKPAEDDAALVHVPLAPLSVPNSPAPTLAQSKRRLTPEPILTIPSRPRHGHHLRPSPNFFHLDLNAFIVPPTPRTPHTPHTAGTPRTTRTPVSPYPTTPAARQHTRTRFSPVRPVFTHVDPHDQRRRGPARRRPAPLNIVANVPMRGVSPEVDEDAMAKRDFLEASFAPEPAPVVLLVPMHREPEHRPPVQLLAVHVDGERVLKKKTSRALLSLFGRK